MKAYITTICAILLCGTFCYAQTSEKQKLNAVSLELGKTGVIWNVNFDHKFSKKNYGFRFGAGSNLGSHLTLISFGGGGYYLIGSKNNFFEMGLDMQYLTVIETNDDQRGFASIFVYPNYPIKTLYPSLNVGYRRYGQNKLFRVGLSPGLIKSKLLAGGYISYGFRF